MRVSIFADVDTGLNPYLILFKKALERRGFKVSLERRLTLRWLVSKGKACDCIHIQWLNQAYIPSIPDINVRIIKRLIDTRLIIALLQMIRLIHFTLVLLFARMQGKTIVYTVHDLDEYQKQSLRGIILIRMAHYIVFFLSHSIHVHNRYSLDLIETRYKIKRGICVIPHGNYIGFYPNKITKSQARRKLGLPEGAFVYLFLGLIRPYKGLEDLFAAFKSIESPELRLLVAGRVFGAGSYEAAIKQICREDSRIRLVTEFISDEYMQFYMNACDIFVLPYKHITTSGAASLALSFGRPIIAPAITSFPEVVTPESGILYDASKPDGLVSALAEAKTRSWSECKVFDYAHQFDWEKLGPQLSALYEKQIHKKTIYKMKFQKEQSIRSSSKY
jgi:beta-1,4-mannosyltransferase